MLKHNQYICKHASLLVVSSSSPTVQLLISSWHLFRLAFAQRGQQGETPRLDNGWKVWLPGCPSHLIIPHMVVQF